MNHPLTMQHFLSVVVQHRTSTREHLLAEGYHPNVIYRKAEKASMKGYTDFGVIADRPWIEPAGLAYLVAVRAA